MYPQVRGISHRSEYHCGYKRIGQIRHTSQTFGGNAEGKFPPTAFHAFQDRENLGGMIDRLPSLGPNV